MITAMFMWIFLNFPITIEPTKEKVEYIYLDTTYIVAHHQPLTEKVEEYD